MTSKQFLSFYSCANPLLFCLVRQKRFSADGSRGRRVEQSSRAHLPYIPLVDGVSTLFLLTFGGKETGPLARPVYEQYGQIGLIALSIFVFLVLLGCVWFLKYAKTRIKQGERSKPNRVALVVAITLFFFGEAFLTGIIARNFLVLLFLPSLTLVAIQHTVTLVYFVLVCFFSRTEMKRLIID